jgi:hypothetical protein
MDKKEKATLIDAAREGLNSHFTSLLREYDFTIKSLRTDAIRRSLNVYEKERLEVTFEKRRFLRMLRWEIQDRIDNIADSEIAELEKE